MLHPLASLWRHPARVSFHDSGSGAGLVDPASTGAGMHVAFAERRRFRSVGDAREYLRYWIADPAARAELRWVLQRAGPSLTSSHSGGDAWVYALAGFLSSGSIVVLEVAVGVARPGRLAAAAASTTAEIAALPALGELAAASPGQPPPSQERAGESGEVAPDEEEVQEPAGSAEAVLQAAQAETLEQAAEVGVPFCEVCARAQAALEDEAGAAEHDEQPAQETPVAVEQIAQAEALEQAATSAVPFCEVCEQQRIARQEANGG
jgi:hypothetical protein